MLNGITFIGLSLVCACAVGWLAQRNGVAPPPPVLGIDLGTTFSSVAIFQTGIGQATVVADRKGRKSIPSVVAFLPNGSVLVGDEAVAQQSLNPRNTIYDAKRFIGRKISADKSELSDFKEEVRRYPFEIGLDPDGKPFFEVEQHEKTTRKLSPEEVGGLIIRHLRAMALDELGILDSDGKVFEKKKFTEIVISVPAEFDERQRNATNRAVELAGLTVRRMLSEPTAAALAYGLHKKPGVEYIIVVDLGGGTLDVSVLWLMNTGVFVTQAMAGNNRLGGQDFNERLQALLLKRVHEQSAVRVSSKEDLQKLRLAIEEAKIRLTYLPETRIRLNLNDSGKFDYLLTRSEFERVNSDLFESVLQPIKAALEDAQLRPGDIDEIVLVGGSTQIPRVRQIVASFFHKTPNYGVDPETAVVLGVAVQAGVVANGSPLQVAALELPAKRLKRHVYSKT